MVAGGLATVISVLVGVSAAYLGGIPDDVISFVTNVVLVIPTFPLVIVLSAYAGKPTLTIMIAVLVVTGWSYGANQMRAQALSLRNRDFLESARVRGERRSYIIVFEMLPTMVSLIIANFLGAALYSVLAAAGLQFLGLGDPNSDSWGTMLYWADSQSALESGTAWWAILPALGIAVARRRLRPDELRLRRDQQPGAAAREQAAQARHAPPSGPAPASGPGPEPGGPRRSPAEVREMSEPMLGADDRAGPTRTPCCGSATCGWSTPPRAARSRPWPGWT